MSTPRQVFQRLSTGIGSGDWSRLHLLYAEDATVELPFARPAVVRLQGRTQVKEHFARFAGRAGMRPQDLRIHETADPEVIVAEYDYEVRGVRLANIQVLRVRDGLIVESRDFHHHAALAEIMS